MEVEREGDNLVFAVETYKKRLTLIGLFGAIFCFRPKNDKKRIIFLGSPVFILFWSILW